MYGTNPRLASSQAKSHRAAHPSVQKRLPAKQAGNKHRCTAHIFRLLFDVEFQMMTDRSFKMFSTFLTPLQLRRLPEVSYREFRV